MGRGPLRLSVALCTFNGARFLEEQLASLARQTRLPEELVVCDDGSSDATIAILERFAATAPFTVRLFRNPVNLGSSKNFERAFGLCDGDVILPADQDDVWLPEKLARFEEVFRAEPGVGLAFSDGWIIDETSARTTERMWPNLPFLRRQQQCFERGEGARFLLRYNVVTGAASAFRASLLPAIVPIGEGWVQDAWVAAVAGSLSEIRLIAEPTLRYRRHTSQQIGIRPWRLPVQWRAARAMDLAYFEKRVACFRALADRLEELRARLLDPSLLEAVRAKVAHSEVQVAMRRRGRLGRGLLALRELIAGNYHRFGRGFKSFAVDAIL